MFHLNTEQLIDYWRAQRGADPVPRRASIDPTQILRLMPQLFMLGRLGPGQYQFRLLGDFVTDLHSRDLRRADFLDLWLADDRISLQMALEAVRRRAEPLVVTCRAHAKSGRCMRMEMAMAPLSGSDGEPNRFLGLYQPISPVADLMGDAALSLSIHAITTPDTAAEAFPRLRLAATHGLRVG